MSSCTGTVFCSCKQLFCSVSSVFRCRNKSNKIETSPVVTRLDARIWQQNVQPSSVLACLLLFSLVLTAKMMSMCIHTQGWHDLHCDPRYGCTDQSHASIRSYSMHIYTCVKMSGFLKNMFNWYNSSGSNNTKVIVNVVISTHLLRIDQSNDVFLYISHGIYLTHILTHGIIPSIF